MSAWADMMATLRSLIEDCTHELFEQDKVDSYVDERDAAAHKVGAGRTRAGKRTEVSLLQELCVDCG